MGGLASWRQAARPDGEEPATEGSPALSTPEGQEWLGHSARPPATPVWALGLGWPCPPAQSLPLQRARPVLRSLPLGVSPTGRRALGWSPSPALPTEPHSRWHQPMAPRTPLRGGQRPLLCWPEGRPPPPRSSGPGWAQGGGFTLSPPQTGHVEKKAGGAPAWGPPASQGSPGAGPGSATSAPEASAACPRRRAHPTDVGPPGSPAAPSPGPPCTAGGVRSLGA